MSEAEKLERHAQRSRWAKGRTSHPEQIWSALLQIADIDFSRDDFSVGTTAVVYDSQPASRKSEPAA